MDDNVTPSLIEPNSAKDVLLATLRDIREPVAPLSYDEIQDREPAALRRLADYKDEMRRRARLKYGPGSAKVKLLNMKINKDNIDAMAKLFPGLSQPRSDLEAAGQPEGAPGDDSNFTFPDWLVSWSDLINLGRERVPGDGKSRPAPEMARFDTYLPQKPVSDQ